MEKYRFNHIAIDLENPTIQEYQVNYVVGDSHVSITIQFIAENTEELHTVHIGGMQNTSNWGDSEVVAFATAEFEKYKITES